MNVVSLTREFSCLDQGGWDCDAEAFRGVHHVLISR